jgi:hypothetical protein
MPLSSTKKDPRESFFPTLTVAAPVTGAAAAGSVAAGGLVAAACGLHAASSINKPTNILKTKRVVFIFSPFEFGLSKGSTLYGRQLD